MDYWGVTEAFNETTIDSNDGVGKSFHNHDVLVYYRADGVLGCECYTCNHDWLNDDEEDQWIITEHLNNGKVHMSLTSRPPPLE
jgi:hypothetical protein